MISFIITFQVIIEETWLISTYFKSFRSEGFPLSTRFRSLSSRIVPPIVTQIVSYLDRAPRSSVITISAKARTCGVEFYGGYRASANACSIPGAGAGACAGASACADVVAGAGASACAGAGEGAWCGYDTHPMPNLDALDGERLALALWDRRLWI